MTVDHVVWRSRPARRLDEPAAGRAGPTAPADRGAVRPGHLRRHRRPVPQEADAAVYDLANRGLLPPGFSLVGFARRDWEDEDFAQVVHDAVKEHARTPFREEVWQQLAEGMRFVPGDFDDDTRSSS